jgi:hypothetical protein
VKVLSKLARGEKPKPKSLYRGVSLSPSGKFVAQYTEDGRTKTIGTFDSELAAAHSFNDVARRLGRPINLLPLESLQ